MRVLIVEDDADLRGQLVAQFTAEGFVVDAAADGEDGLYKATEFPLDLAVVDLGLPKLPGTEVIKRARKKGLTYPILILTARDGWENKVAGLEAGADDYLVKPFHAQELLARARALLRRSGGWATATLESGPVALDTTARAVRLAGAPLELTAYEFRLLEYLMLNAGKVISKSTLTEHLYAEDMERDSNVIEVFVRRLRSKLDPDERLKPIETLRGQGYRWNLPRT